MAQVDSKSSLAHRTTSGSPDDFFAFRNRKSGFVLIVF
ncbi:hypothetical protein EC5412_2133 [Escherichia coli 5412]|nr:hypothetical protein EC5412_2133 [Escherichia coli 5412]